MITVLPASGEEKSAFLAQEPEALELFLLRDGETERGRAGESPLLGGYTPARGRILRRKPRGLPALLHTSGAGIVLKE